MSPFAAEILVMLAFAIGAVLGDYRAHWKAGGIDDLHDELDTLNTEANELDAEADRLARELLRISRNVA
jgi:hypothetical protein